jgi:hypothetical protein
VFSANCQGFLGAENPQNAHCNQYLNASSGLFAGAKLEGGHFWLAGTSGQLLWRFKSTIKPPPVVPVDATSFSRRETLRRLLWGTLIYFAIAAAMLAYKWRQEQQKMAATKKRVTVLQAAGKNIFGEFFSGEWSPDLVKDQSAIIHKLRRHITGSKRQGATVLKQEFLSSVRHKLPASTFISFLDMQVDKSLGEHAGMRENLVSFKDQCNAEFYPARDQFHILWQVWREGIQTRGLKRFLRYLSETPAGAGSQHANCLDRDLEFLESFIDTLGRYSNSLVKISDRFLDQGEVRIAWDKKIKHFLMLLSGRNESIRMHSIGETLTHLFRDEVSLRWDYAGLKEASVPAEILFSLFFSLELAAQVADVPSDAVKVQVQGRLDTIYLAIEPSSFDQDQRSHYVESLRQVFRVTEYESFQVQLSGEENKAAMVVSWEPTGNSALMVQKESMAKPVVRNIESQKTL